MGKFKKIFRRLPDPRADNARHDLVEVLVIALAAMLCGAETCSDMAEFGQAKEGLLRLFLRLEHGIPSHDTFSRVFRLLKPEAFEAAFQRFMAAFAKANRLKISGVVALDGKALRGAFAHGQRTTPLHLVNVWAVEARMALAQQRAPGRNETAGALQVRDLLSLEGCIITADACIAIAPWQRGCSSGAATAGDQGQPGALVHGRGRAFCTVRQAQRGQATRAIHSRPARIAARDSHAQHQLGRCLLQRKLESKS
jgi:predicted transposase YbfD/YdcC